MSNQPIFAVCQLTRANDFLVSTYLLERDGERVIVKKPNSSKSRQHVASMVSTYEKLCSEHLLDGLISPVPAKLLSDGTVEFEYIKGAVVERQLIKYVLDGKQEEALEVIDKLMRIIDALPVVYGNPSLNPVFKTVFGESYAEKMECVTPGIVDINLDNVIVDSKNGWHLIDYEWVFDFPIPKTYIKQRFFYWFFFIRYREILNMHRGRIEHECVAADTVVPVYVYERYGWAFHDTTKVISAESAFQEYVLGRKEPLDDIRIFATSQHKNAEKIPISKGFLPELLALNEKLISHIDELKTRQLQVEAELNDIRRSRAYRAANKIARAKHKISIKK